VLAVSCGTALSDEPVVQATRVAAATVPAGASVAASTVAHASQPVVPEGAATDAGADVRKAEILQTHLARLAREMPGMRCEPYGAVYLVLGAAAGAESRRLDHADLLIHFADSGRPDEVRVEHSSGNPDVDADLSQQVCELVHVREIGAGSSAAGWARMAVRLSGAD
jgi:hypothetical protein